MNVSFTISQRWVWEKAGKVDPMANGVDNEHIRHTQKKDYNSPSSENE